VDTSGKLLIVYRNQPCHQVTMTPQVLCRAVDNDIGPQLNRLLQIWSHKGIVHYCKQSSFFSDSCHSVNIGDPHQRVGGRLDEHSLPYHFWSKHDIFQNGHMRKQIELLEYHAHL